MFSSILKDFLRSNILRITGSASHTSAEFWMYDSRLGRRWNVDPVDQSEISDYACFNNNPLLMNDVNGDEPEGGPGKDGTKEGETYVEKYLPGCKECNEYKYKTWIWHMGGVNESEAEWMSVSDYNEDVLKPMALEHNSNFFSESLLNYKMNLRNAGLEPNALLGDARSYFLANPTYDGWKSYIPIWGSYQQAKLDFAVGKDGWGTVNSILAISDVFLLRSVLWKGSKYAIGLYNFSGELNTWKQYRKFYGEIGFAAPYQHMHHSLVYLNGERSGQGILWHIKNAPWNMKAMEGSTWLGLTGPQVHTLVHGKTVKRNGINWSTSIIGYANILHYGTNTFTKTSFNYSVGLGLNSGRNNLGLNVIQQ